ncbi:MAG: DUF4376 domain-containing protein [Moraxella sp.]|nr:DUF4376 domain-containing protein [Moraxella sp.]
MIKFSPIQQAFYDTSFEYHDLPDDLVEISKDEHTKLLEQINDGHHILADLSAIKRPSIHHQYIDGEWVLSIDKNQAQQEVWEAIKTYRHTITRGGVYVKSVGKWFHTDDSSRTQYLALQILPEIPPDLTWKTMDNTFVKMDKALLTELAMTILQAEQADFANAERHRAAMMEANNPFDYDFGRGWSDTYDQQ